MSEEQVGLADDDASDAQLPIGENGTGVEDEDASSSAEITEPFDPSLIRVETKTLTIDLILNRIEKMEIDLAPEFQRKAGLWKATAKSRLIESILVRIPLPAFYMDATDDNRWLVVDGLQRLSTLKSFVLDNDFELSGLEFLKLKGTTYSGLPRHLQRRIQETQVTVYLIERGTPPEVKFNIFKRINTGGLPLSGQEIRHALNQGPATRLLADLAESVEFKKATSFGIRDDRMADRECVLRFLAFYLSDPAKYKSSDFDKFLNESMAKLNAMSKAERDRLSAEFLRAMVVAQQIFGSRAFRKPSSKRAPINKPLFESWAVNLARRSDEVLKVLVEKKSEVAQDFEHAMREYQFEQAVSAATGDPSKVSFRFARVAKIIESIAVS